MKLFFIGFIVALAVIIFLVYGFFSVLGSRKNIASVVEKIMNQYDISKEDLKSLANVKAKIRNFNIDQII